VIVGEKSPVKLQNEVMYLDVTLKANRTFTCGVRGSFNAIVYVLEGTIKIGGTMVSKSVAGLLTDGDSVEISADDPARLVVIGGKPHGEEIVLRGSFIY
jgi:hypothetical protein